MKKDNKILAQKKREEQRKKQKRQKSISVICKIGIPSILLIGLIAFCITKVENKT